MNWTKFISGFPAQVLQTTTGRQSHSPGIVSHHHVLITNRARQITRKRRPRRTRKFSTSNHLYVINDKNLNQNRTTANKNQFLISFVSIT
jgi:hypothetical protein